MADTNMTGGMTGDGMTGGSGAMGGLPTAGSTGYGSTTLAGDGASMGVPPTVGAPVDPYDQFAKGGTGGTSADPLSAAGLDVQGLKAHAGELKDKAVDKARDYAVQGKDRAAGALDTVAAEARNVADKLAETQAAPVAELVRKAGDSVEQFSARLRGKDLNELVSDMRSLVRESPAIAIGAAAAIGFVLARFLKAGDDHGA